MATVPDSSEETSPIESIAGRLREFTGQSVQTAENPWGDGLEPELAEQTISQQPVPETIRDWNGYTIIDL